MGVGGVVGWLLSVCCIERMFIAGSRADGTSPVSRCASESDEDIWASLEARLLVGKLKEDWLFGENEGRLGRRAS